MAKYGSGDGRWFVRPTELPTLNFKQFKPHIQFSAANEFSNHGRHIHHLTMSTYDPSNNKSDYMGAIQWHAQRGEILGVSVEPEYRRMGVAHTLFHEAKRIAREQGLAEPVHSEDRSDMGDAWAKSVGGELPKRKKLSDFPTL